MSIRAMTWAWGLDELPLRESMVLLALADQANDDGVCWPSQDLLARRARCSRRSLQRSLAALKDAGLVEVEPRASAYGRKSSVYRVRVGVEFSLESRQSANLTLWVEGSDDEPVDNPENRWDSGKASDWRFGSEPVDNRTQSATGGASQSATGGALLPYRVLNPQLEPSLPPTPHGEPDADAGSEGADGRPTGSTPAASPPRAGRPMDASSGPSDADRDLVDACLPASMRPLPDSGTATVARRLRDLVASGWTAVEVRSVLGATALPAEVRSMPHLVLHRLKDLDPEGSTAAREARRENAEQFLEACIPATLKPLRGPGREDLAVFLRRYVDAGSLSVAEVRTALEGVSVADGHPSTRQILAVLRTGGLLDRAAGITHGGAS